MNPLIASRKSVRKYYKLLLVVSAMLVCICAAAQPANDNCSNASTITIPGSGYSSGNITSATIDITHATIQNGESFAPAILATKLDQKSVWYKFSLPTTRSVRVTLAQSGTAITAGDVGFAVYKTSTCLPTIDSLSTKLTPLATFGNTYNPCVDPGVYLIQVSADNNANGNIYLQLDVQDSTGALYDLPTQAYDFGTLSTNNSYVDYAVECQSVDNAQEVCNSLSNYHQYTRSTWHTFTTPAYFDYIGVIVASPNGFFQNGTATFGYNLYMGDSKTQTVSSLKLIDGCDSFVTSGYTADYKLYECNTLKPNTTYTIQLFYDSTFIDFVRLGITFDGTAATKAPQPILSQMPASNIMGPLLGNTTTTATDYFGCNSHVSYHPCGGALPAAGVNFNGITYNLSTFFTFQLTTSANINIWTNLNFCSQIPPLIRLFSQNVTNNCSSLDTSGHLVAEFQGSFTGLGCLLPGTYTAQIMGTDSITQGNLFYFSPQQGNPLCIFSNLGEQLSFNVNVTPVRALDTFCLDSKIAYNAINDSAGKMQPLQNGVTYQALPDTFGCHNTVMPTKVLCDTVEDKAIYREVVIGDANGDHVADSGILSISGYQYNNNFGHTVGYTLFKGDAASLATAQNAFDYPDTIKGLTLYSDCNRWSIDCGNVNSFCVVPGTYTLTSLGTDYNVNQGDQPSFQFNLVTTTHKNAATAQNLGSILDTIGGNTGNISSDYDYFSCIDNAVTIHGFAPPDANNYGHPATKAIYREFYLKSTSLVSIQQTAYSCYYGVSAGTSVLFSGKASNGLGGLVAQQVNGQYYGQSISTPACNPLPAGWYTVVSYGNGPTYGQPLQSLAQGIGYGSDIGYPNQITISVTQACPPPMYDRPYKACVDSTTKQPFLLQFATNSAGTAAYPVTDTTYVLYTENFNCQTDTPFSKQPIVACDPSVDRVAYYVFQVNKQSYLQINTQGLWGEVFAADVRKDSSKFTTLTPIQPCLQSTGYIELCKVQPGTYTLVVFASDANVSNGCGSVTPTIYIDQTGYSRFDFAQKAYDFGTVPADSTFHNGKIGDVNPLNVGRAPSDDFFYCTTGSAQTDPTESACSVVYDSLIYARGNNTHLWDQNVEPPSGNIERRNLWYTFVVDKPGWVTVLVNNMSPDKTSQYPFSVYKSDVDGTLPFSKVVSTGQVDSTEAQGLTFIDGSENHNYSYWWDYYYCYWVPDTITFYRDPCIPSVADRYYVLVENPNNYPNLPGMQVNSQVEVSVRVDTVNAIRTKFDHYYDADNMGNLGGGVDTGAVDNFSCATSDSTDPVLQENTCAPKTLWYKFTTAVNGNVRFLSLINGVETSYQGNDLYLYKQITPGDSTSAGLQYQGAISWYDQSNGYNWGETCLTPGTYYLIASGCQQTNQNFQPIIIIDSVPTKFDHYYQASTIGTNLGSGTYTGAMSNFSCATSDATDPVLQQTGCAPKTLWYKFTTNITGNCAFITKINGVLSNYQGYDIYIYRQVVPGDSTSVGLEYESAGNYTDSLGNVWGEHCIYPGTYYLIITGCNRTIENVQPVISIIPDAGDFCSNPVVATISGVGSTVATAVVDCHTIGTDYGEFGPTLSCPPGAITANYKSTWFRIDITGADTLDITSYLVTNTSDPNSGDIQYRLMTGDCSAMQETSCVEDALTQNTYKCLPAGSYYLQVFTPALYPIGTGNPVTGTINLHVTAAKHADTCAPIQNCLATANFVPQFDCNAGPAVTFTNYSTYGTEITNTWYFGYNGKTSTAVAPSFTYPALPHDTIYNVKLVIKNTQCGGSDSVTVPVSIPGRPVVNLGNDISTCNQDTTITLNATSFSGATYYWQDGTGTPTYTVTQPGYNQFWVIVNYNNCSSSDTVNIFIDPLQKNSLQYATACLNSTVNLYDGNDPNIYVNGNYIYPTYLWNTGATDNNITVANAGMYWVNKSLHGCTVRDSFLVNGGNIPIKPLGADSVSVCLASPYNVDATVANASGYQWQDGTNSPQYSITAPGTYWVNIYVGGCTFTDSLVVTAAGPAAPVITGDAIFCKGSATKLDAGAGYAKYVWNNNDTTRTISVTAPGVYNVAGYDSAGCSTSSKNITVVEDSVATPVITGATTICYNDSTMLDAGAGYANYLWSTGDTTQTIIVSKPGVVKVTVKGPGGCGASDSVLVKQIPAQKVVTATATVCGGQADTLPSGKVITQPGFYTDTVKNTNGCDSLITNLTLVVDTAAIVDTSIRICSGQTYTLPSGKTVGTAGVYTDTVYYKNTGCDSLVSTVNVSVLSVKTVDTTVQICPGQQYNLPSGKAVNTTGHYSDTVRYAAGCDSLITNLVLQVDSAKIVDAVVTLCQGQSYTLPSGRVISSSGAYSDTLKYTTGCDSLITNITLVINIVRVVDTSVTICQGQTYTLPSGRVISSSGAYSDTLKYTTGCDSLVTNLTLAVNATKVVDTSANICPGEYFTLPSGKKVNITGHYTDTIKYASGCDSLVTNLTLMVDSAKLADTAITLCQGQTYTLPSGRVINSSGTYNDTIKYVTGCDSLITIANVTVYAPRLLDTGVAICQGQTYTLPSGRVVGNPGVYNDTVMYAAAGCDSIVTHLVLTIDSVKIVDTSIAICQGQTYTLPSGKTVNTTGHYTDTVKYVTGCDSLITNLVLMVDSAKLVDTSVILCQGQTYTLPSGRVINSSGTYNDTLRYTTGCDSLVTVANITVNTVRQVDTSIAICQGQTYTLPSGRVVGSSGVYSDTSRYGTGCDSIITQLTLIIDSVRTVDTTVVLCQGEGYVLPSGRMVSTAGNYTDTVKYTAGCDSLITNLTLVVNSVKVVDTSATLCQGQTYTLPSGRVINSSGIYNDTLRYTTGCDSLVTNANITVNTVRQVDTSIAICQGQTYTLPSGRVVGSSGVYSDTLRYATGCDSIITQLTLIIDSAKVIDTIVTICQGQSYVLPSGRKVSTAGNYMDTIKYTAGCDSLITNLTLVVNIAKTVDTTITLCQGQTYKLPSGRVISSAGIYNDTLRYTTSCDSLVTIANITVNTVRQVDTSIAICQGQTYSLPSGRVVSSAGYYSDTVRYVSGCDSLITYASLSVNNVTIADTSVTLCQGKAYTLPSGVSVNLSGHYRDTLRYATGCDSLITNLNLTVDSVPVISSNDTICVGQTFVLPWGITVSAPGQYNDTLRYTGGCDSLVTVVNLAVVQMPVVAFNPDSVYIVGIAGVRLNPIIEPQGVVEKYLWSPPVGLTPSDSVANPVANPSERTVYQLTVTTGNGCSGSGKIIVLSGSPIEMPSAFTPNGDGHNDIYRIPAGAQINLQEFDIYNRFGNLIFSTKDPGTGWDGTYAGYPQPTGTYVYMVRGTSLTGRPIFLKGTVVLVR